MTYSIVGRDPGDGPAARARQSHETLGGRLNRAPSLPDAGVSGRQQRRPWQIRTNLPPRHSTPLDAKKLIPLRLS